MGVGKKFVRNAKTVKTSDGQGSLIGRDWLTIFQFKVGEQITKSEYTVSSKQNMEEKQKFQSI